MTTDTPKATFISKYPDLRIVRIAKDLIRGEGGRRVGMVAPGSPLNERYGVEDDHAPWEIQFEKGVFETDDPILIAWLRNHKPFDPATGTGDSSVESGGYGIDFYEQDAAPEELKPTLTEQQERISTATARLDVADLEAVLNEEKETHNREPVVRGAEAALKAIAEGLPEQGADAVRPNPDSGSTGDPHRSSGSHD